MRVFSMDTVGTFEDHFILDVPDPPIVSVRELFKQMLVHLG